MYRTAEEARQCWCPFARVYNVKMHEELNLTPGPAYNRIICDLESDRCAEMAADEGSLKCIANHCMAWRGDGFCGLMGRP